MNNNDDVFSELIEEDENGFNIFLDTLQEVFEGDLGKGNQQHGR